MSLPDAAGNRERLPPWVVLGPALLALAVTLGLADAPHPPGVFTKYLDAAVQQTFPDPSRLLDFSPLYLLFARGCALVGGATLMLGLQCLAFAVACAAVATTVTRLANARWGLAAGLFTASYRPFIVYCGVLEPELLILVALALAIDLGTRARALVARDPAIATRRTTIVAGIALLAVSLAGLLRPQYLLLAPVWLCWIACRAPRTARRRLVLVGIVACVLPLAPVVAERWWRAGTPMVMDPGQVFYEGNWPGATGVSGDAPRLVKWVEEVLDLGGDSSHVAYRRLASAAAGRPLSTADSNSYWTGLAFEGVRASPAAAARLLLAKLAMALGPYELHDLIDAQELDRRLRPRLPWGFGVLLLAAPLVLLVGADLRNDLLGPAVLALLPIVVQTLLTASARQRLPLSLALVVLVPVAAHRALAAAGSGRRPLVLALALGAVAWTAEVSVTGRSAAIRETRMVRELGAQARPVDDRVAAVLDGRAFFAADRAAENVLIEAQAKLAAGLSPDAQRLLEPLAAEAEARAPYQRARILAWLARTRSAAGDRAGAAAAATAAAALAPRDPEIAALALVLRGSGDPVAAATAWRPPGIDPLSARMALAQELAFAGHGDRARALGAQIVSVLPELAAAGAARARGSTPR